MSENLLPDLGDWEPTHQTLHLYSKAVGVILRAHAEAHPKWWHFALSVVPDGLVSTEMSLPDGGTATLKMDLKGHKTVLSTSSGKTFDFDHIAGLTSTEMGDKLIAAAVAPLGEEEDEIEVKADKE